MLSKSKIRHPLNVCGDCGASGPSWASINRGILICSECCSVHRSLGRHISHVKCLRQNNWIPEQLLMVQNLYSLGANSIWEYSLLNPSKKDSGSSSSFSKGSGTSNSGSSAKKPSASDPLHPLKADFIRAKHASLLYVFKPSKDDVLVSESELSRQLHSSVRTPNLETSLRLLSQGADPNYFHPEKNSSPLMVAGKAGQAAQVELLLVYGADPGVLDKNGKTASELAENAGHTNVSNRLEASLYELSDRLSYFLCQKKPDHSSGSHFLIPELDKYISESIKIAKRKLLGLNNSVFEELSIDVYDEVDRRETDGLWTQFGNSGNKSVLIPFLPVNPDYGTTRNQGRQKLARLNPEEFASLVIDVLKEIKRRQNESRDKDGSETSRLSKNNSQSLIRVPCKRDDGCDDEPIYDHVASDDDYYIIHETSSLKTKTNKKKENNNNNNNDHHHHQYMDSKSEESLETGNADLHSIKERDMRALKDQIQAYESKVRLLMESNDEMRAELRVLTSTVNQLVVVSSSSRHKSSSLHLSIPTSERNGVSFLNTITTPPIYDSPSNSYFDYEASTELPTQEEVVRRTEAITRCIQELLISAKDEEFEAFIPCSERIVRAVTDMVILFPEDIGNSGVSKSLSSLTAAAAHFETECRLLILKSQKEGPLSSSFVTQQVIQCAFDIAKSTKQLVALFQ